MAATRAIAATASAWVSLLKTCKGGRIPRSMWMLRFTGLLQQLRLLVWSTSNSAAVTAAADGRTPGALILSLTASHQCGRH
ncbi:hypothetical protein DFH09DRAFT_1187078 [Mycena vulgaris]|nr:hypothetical protein DFH09DRAFT_1187078 [Mycena vulgaris]